MPASYTWTLLTPTLGAAGGTTPGGRSTLVRKPLCFALDADGDLDLSNGSIILLEGAAGIAQNILTALRMFLGEWFLNLDEGTPWWQSILGKNPNAELIRQSLRERILSRRGVTGITSLTLDLDESTRELEVEFEVTSDAGTITGTLVEEVG